MKKPFSYFGASVSLLLGAPTNTSAFEITPVGTFLVSHLANPPNTTGGIGWGLGLSLAQEVGSDVTIEADYFYFNRSENQELPPAATTTYYYQEIPVLVRVKPPGSHFSFGAGAYYAHGIGNIRSELPGATGPTYSSFEDNQLSRTDFGAVVAVGIRWPLVSVVSFYGDGRCQVGLKNINLSGGSGEEWRDYFQFVGGITLSL